MIGGSFQDSVKLYNAVFGMFSVCRENTASGMIFKLDAQLFTNTRNRKQNDK